MTAKNFPEISVIIPLYNAEKYIGACLESLANQTFQDFEVIVADDCSTDKSRSIVTGFDANRFGGGLKLLKLSKNSGIPSTPRNFALKKARGKYVYFLDSDDLLTPTAFEELINVAEDFDADVVHCEKYFVFPDELGIDSAEVFTFQTGEFVTEPTLETSDIGERVTAFTEKRFLWWACNKLFRRKLLIDNKITFPEIRSFEDMVFALECLIAAKNYVRVPFVSYYYRFRKDSLSHKKITIQTLMNTLIGVVKNTNDFMNGRKFFVDNPQYRYALTDFFMQERIGVFVKSFLNVNYGVGMLCDFLRMEIFERRPQNIVALTSYLFITANILKLYTKQQEADIAELKRQLSANP